MAMGTVTTRQLRAIPREVAREVAEVMEDMADEIVLLAKRLCPSDRLRPTIGWTWGSAPSSSLALSSEQGPRRGMQLTIFAGNESTMVEARAYRVQLAVLIEFGTAPHTNEGRFAGSQHPGAAAEPFFLPAYRSIRRRAKRRISGAMRRGIKRATARR